MKGIAYRLIGFMLVVAILGVISFLAGRILGCLLLVDWSP